MVDGTLELYYVQLLRRSQPGLLQMNFGEREPAEAAFRLLQTRVGVVGDSIMLSDGFGASICVDLGDILHVAFTDAAKTLEFRAIEALMQARAQDAANRRASVDPMIGKPGIMVPARGH